MADEARTMKDVLIDNNGKAFKPGQRKKVKITKDFGSLKTGMVIKPHVLKADLLIENKVAKEVK